MPLILFCIFAPIITMMIYITRKEHFNAAHRMYREEWSEEKNINKDVDFMTGKMASTELLCIEIFNQLKKPVEAYPGVFLHSVKLYETENNSAEYFGN